MRRRASGTPDPQLKPARGAVEGDRPEIQGDGEMPVGDGYRRDVARNANLVPDSRRIPQREQEIILAAGWHPVLPQNPLVGERCRLGGCRKNCGEEQPCHK